MNRLTAFIVKFCITDLLEASYRHRTEKKVLKFIFKTILDIQQSEFREDNEPTKVSYIVEQLVLASDLKPSWGMYKKLMPEYTVCPKCEGDQVQKCGKCDCTHCGGTGIEFTER
jgi:DnaJ-class molecular chaperone